MSHADTESLVRNPLINYVNFTGSVEGGHQIQKAASDKFIGKAHKHTERSGFSFAPTESCSISWTTY